MLKVIAAIALLGSVSTIAIVPASYAAQVLVSINENSQQMTVSVDGQQEYVWPVSTGITRYATPTGSYKPFRMEVDHFSEEWDDAPMPHSIFFTRLGHAIHGTEHVDHLGRRASHGCVRLAPEDAATLYALVEEAGMANATVVVKGRAHKPVSKKPPQRLVENRPQRLVENRQRLVERPLKNPQYPKHRRDDDPFLWRESFN